MEPLSPLKTPDVEALLWLTNGRIPGVEIGWALIWKAELLE
jgi:hypothetical protein